MLKIKTIAFAMTALCLAAAAVATPAMAAPKAKAHVVDVDLTTACAKGGSLAFDGINGSHAQARRDAGCARDEKDRGAVG